MIDLSGWALAGLALAALIVGVSKTALPGGSTIAVALFASILPARSSTATLLVLLIVGDIIALSIYRRHADWKVLWRLAPAVVAGMVLGALFLLVANDAWVRRSIGVILLLLIAFTLWLRRRPASASAAATHGAGMAIGYGSLGGFTTMVANAGGPPMSMYFLASGFPVKAFLGTSAWFFAIVNVMKVPFAAGIGLITPQTLMIDAMLAPVVIIGAGIGWLIAGRISQRVFDVAVITLTVIGAIYLLI